MGHERVSRKTALKTTDTCALLSKYIAFIVLCFSYIVPRVATTLLEARNFLLICPSLPSIFFRCNLLDARKGCTSSRLCRYFLLDKNSSEPVYYGCRFKPFVKQGYMSGGAGYVLSREALRRLIEVGLRDPKKCRADGRGAEDVEMGKCLENLGVDAGDTRDAMGRGRFFPLVPESHLIPGQMPKDFWFWTYAYYPFQEVGSQALSTQSRRLVAAVDRSLQEFEARSHTCDQMPYDLS